LSNLSRDAIIAHYRSISNRRDNQKSGHAGPPLLPMPNIPIKPTYYDDSVGEDLRVKRVGKEPTAGHNGLAFGCLQGEIDSRPIDIRHRPISSQWYFTLDV
jgi:hypothetical protein